MGKKKGHHFLPRFYLKSFGIGTNDNPLVWVHEKDEEPQKLPVSEIGKKKHLYSTRKKVDGEHDVKNEDILSDAENVIAPVYRKVLAAESADVLDAEERSLFGIFVLLMTNRTPRSFGIADVDYKKMEVETYHEAVSKCSDEDFRQIYEKAKTSRPEQMKDVSYEEAREVMLEGPKVENIRLSHSAGIVAMWGSIEALPLLMKMDWKFWVPTDNHRFVTSDDPVVGVVNDERGGILMKPGWGHNSLEVTFPLSPTLCFVGTKGGEKGRIGLEGESVPIINELRVLMSHQYVYASRKFEFQNLFEERNISQAPEHWKLDKLY